MTSFLHTFQPAYIDFFGISGKAALFLVAKIITNRCSIYFQPLSILSNSSFILLVFLPHSHEWDTLLAAPSDFHLFKDVIISIPYLSFQINLFPALAYLSTPLPAVVLQPT